MMLMRHAAALYVSARMLLISDALMSFAMLHILLYIYATCRFDISADAMRFFSSSSFKRSYAVYVRGGLLLMRLMRLHFCALMMRL